MTDSDADLEELRRRKLEELQETAGDGGEGSGTDDEQATPTDPVYLETTDGFDSFVETHDTVLVDFFADWCGPCKQLDPVVSDVAADTDAAVLKVDIDENPQLASAQNVRGVPTLVLFAGGEPVERLVGYQNGQQLRTLIERHG